MEFSHKRYSAKQLEEKLCLGRSQVLELCKEYDVEKIGNSYAATEEQYQKMEDRKNQTLKIIRSRNNTLLTIKSEGRLFYTKEYIRNKKSDEIQFREDKSDKVIVLSKYEIIND